VCVCVCEEERGATTRFVVQQMDPSMFLCAPSTVATIDPYTGCHN